MLIMVVDGYEPPVDDISNNIERRMTNEQKKKDYKNLHKARTIMLNAISYT